MSACVLGPQLSVTNRIVAMLSRAPAEPDQEAEA